MEGGFPTVAQIWQFLSYPTSFSPIQGLSAHGKTITGTHTHTDSHTLPHSLIHTEDTYVLSPPGNGFLLIFENTRNRERKNNLALSRKFVPLKINNPSWDLDLRGEQGALFLSHISCVWTWAARWQTVSFVCAASVCGSINPFQWVTCSLQINFLIVALNGWTYSANKMLICVGKKLVLTANYYFPIFTLYANIS